MALIQQTFYHQTRYLSTTAESAVFLLTESMVFLLTESMVLMPNIILKRHAHLLAGKACASFAGKHIFVPRKNRHVSLWAVFAASGSHKMRGKLLPIWTSAALTPAAAHIASEKPVEIASKRFT